MNWLKSKQKPEPQKIIERVAKSSNHLYCWQETPEGRSRLWCKTCKAEGKDWYSPQPCEHILAAVPGTETTKQQALDELLALINEPVDSVANAESQ